MPYSNEVIRKTTEKAIEMVKSRLRARIYCRVSSDEQAEKETIQNQIDFAQKYCDLYDIEIIDWYKDDGVSGTIPLEGRPDGKRLIDDLKSDSIPCIIITFNVKRLGRGARVILNAVYDIEQTGATVRSMTEPFDTETPFGRFMLTILAGEAGFDRESFLYNMWLGANRHAAKGEWLGGIVPYGYRKVGKFLELSEDNIPGYDYSENYVCRMIYYQADALDQTCPKIADYLNLFQAPTSYVKDGRLVAKGKRKIKTATSGLWTPSRVRAILTNPTYKGLHIYGKRSTKKRELIERKVPATVPEDQWDRVQISLRNHQLEAMRNSKRQYLLRGLIKCGKCGLTYIGTWCYGKNIEGNEHIKDNKRGKVYYYRCDGKQSYRGQLLGSCLSKNVPAEWLENIVWDDCVNFILNPGDAIKEVAASLEETKSQRESVETEKQMLLKAVQEKDIEKQRVIDLYRKQIIGFVDVEAQLQKNAIEKENLRLRIRDLDDVIKAEDIATNQMNSIEELLSQFRELIENGTINYEDKRKIVKCLAKEIIVTNLGPEDEIPPREASISITYSFAKGASRTLTDSSPPPA